MIFYVVQDATKWLSHRVFKSIDAAIIYQRWRIDYSHLDSDEDYPLTILALDTKLEYIKVACEISRDVLKAEVKSYDYLKKGGLK